MSNASKSKPKLPAGKPSTTGEKSGKWRDNAVPKERVEPTPNRTPKPTKK